MKTNQLYDLIEKEKIDIVENKMHRATARICEYDNSYFLFLDSSKFENSIKEKEILSEELGHYYYGAFYTLFSSDIEKNRNEYKAKKWSYFANVPYKQLQEVVKNGIDDIPNLANYFEVSYEYMANCIDFYISKYGKVA